MNRHIDPGPYSSVHSACNVSLSPWVPALCPHLPGGMQGMRDESWVLRKHSLLGRRKLCVQAVREICAEQPQAAV